MLHTVGVTLYKVLDFIVFDVAGDKKPVKDTEEVLLDQRIRDDTLQCIIKGTVNSLIYVVGWYPNTVQDELRKLRKEQRELAKGAKPQPVRVVHNLKNI